MADFLFSVTIPRPTSRELVLNLDGQYSVIKVKSMYAHASELPGDVMNIVCGFQVTAPLIIGIPRLGLL